MPRGRDELTAAQLAALGVVRTLPASEPEPEQEPEPERRGGLSAILGKFRGKPVDVDPSYRRPYRDPDGSSPGSKPAPEPPRRGSLDGYAATAAEQLGIIDLGPARPATGRQVGEIHGPSVQQINYPEDQFRADYAQATGRR